MREFQGADTQKQIDLVADAAGLYLWTHDLNPLAGADELMIKARLIEMLKLVGRDRTQAVRPYHSVTVRDERKAISDKKRIILHSEFSRADPFGKWLARLTTLFQRPLYAGMAEDVHRRITQHLQQGSMLRRRLEGKGVDVLDLSVTWVACPLPASTEGDEPDREELERKLKAAESLLIRLTMPMFNESQD